MQVSNVLLAARCKYRTQKSRQKSPSGHHRTTSSSYIFATKARIDNRKKIVKQQCVLHMSQQYGELRPTSGYSHHSFDYRTLNGTWQSWCVFEWKKISHNRLTPGRIHRSQSQFSGLAGPTFTLAVSPNILGCTGLRRQRPAIRHQPRGYIPDNFRCCGRHFQHIGLKPTCSHSGPVFYIRQREAALSMCACLGPRTRVVCRCCQSSGDCPPLAVTF